MVEELGHEVIIANPRQLQVILANQSKIDKNDAHLLAKLARVDAKLLSPLKHRDKEQQMNLLAIRGRAQLVKMRTALIHGSRGMVKTFGLRFARRNERSLRRTLPAKLAGAEAATVEWND